MIEKTIERIKSILPEVEHVVMVYNDGTVFHTTFDKINIRKLGESMAETLLSLEKMYEICEYEYKEYSKLVFETDDVNVMLLKLGENSNLALFFRKKGEPKLHSIQRYIDKVEEILDIDRGELVEQELETKETQVRELKLHLGSQHYKLITLQEFEKETMEEEKKNLIAKEITQVKIDLQWIKEELDKKTIEIKGIKEVIEGENAVKEMD